MSISSIIAGKAFVLLELKDKTKLQLAKFQQEMMRVGEGMMAPGAATAAVAGGLMAPFIASIPVFKDFDDSMRMVEARSEGTKEQMTALRRQAIELGAAMSYTSSEVASLQNILVTKGFDRSKVLAMTKSILEFGRAAGSGAAEDLTIAADLTANAIHAFGLESKDAKRVSDVMTEAVTKSALSLNSLQDAFKYVAPVAHLAGMSLEETVAAIGQLGNVGIEGSTAGTTLRQMLTRLAHKDKAAAFSKSIKEMTGVTIGFNDAAGNLRSIPAILTDIGKAIAHLPSAAKMDAIRRLFGLEAMTGGIILAEGMNPFGDLLSKLQTAEQRNVGSNTAAFMESGTGGAFRQAEGALESLQIQLGEVIDGPLRDLLKWCTSMLETGTQFATTNQETITGMTQGVSAIGAMGASVFGLGVALKYIPIIMTTVTTALGGLPGVVAAAVGGLVIYLYASNEAFRKVANEGLSVLMSGLVALEDVLSPYVYILGLATWALKSFWNLLVDFVAWLSSWGDYFGGTGLQNYMKSYSSLKPGEGDENRSNELSAKMSHFADEMRKAWEDGAGKSTKAADKLAKAGDAQQQAGDAQEAAAKLNEEAAAKQLAAAETALHAQTEAAQDAMTWAAAHQMPGAAEKQAMLAQAQKERQERIKEFNDRRRGLLPGAAFNVEAADKELADLNAQKANIITELAKLDLQRMQAKAAGDKATADALSAEMRGLEIDKAAINAREAELRAQKANAPKIAKEDPQAKRDAREAAKEMADAQVKALKAQRYAPGLVQDLEEGTVAALEKFYDNLQAGEEAKLQAEANKILGRIEKGIDKIPGVNAKG